MVRRLHDYWIMLNQPEKILANHPIQAVSDSHLTDTHPGLSTLHEHGRKASDTICLGIPPGMSFHEPPSYAMEYGLQSEKSHLMESPTLAYLAESRSFGRHSYRVKMIDGRIVRVSYNFAD